MSGFFLSTKSRKIWAELCFLFEFKIIRILLKYKTLKYINRTLVLTVFTEHHFNKHLTKRTAYISDYVKSLSELSCLESRLISELQGAPGSRDHQASPSSLFGYQNTTELKPATAGRIAFSSLYTFGYVALLR